MKKTLVALAAAAAISPAAFAGDVSWGGDANVEGFSLINDLDSTATTDVKERGYSQRIRLKGTFKTDGNVSVNTRLILNDSYWTGDNQGSTNNTVTGVYETSTNDAVAVDYGYIQAPIVGWTFRFGRQVANWANCFLTCDDRRDRILAMKRIGGTTVILLNDKRASSTNDETSPNGEGDLYVAAAVGVVSGWQWGLLGGIWKGEESYILDDVFSLSPYVKGKIGGVKLEGAVNILGGGNSSYALFSDTGISAYLKAGMELGTINLEAQGIIVSDGGLIAGGFDTFTMLVNNNADNNQSNTNVQNIGGLGKYGASYYGYADDEWMIGARVSTKMGKIGLKASATYMALDNDYAGYQEDWTLWTIDGGVTYAVAKTTELYLNAAFGGLDDETTANADRDYSAATLGINTTF